MSWVLEGKRVTGTYHGATVTGVVTHSRVDYGGSVKHHVVVDEGFSTFGGRISREAGETVILDKGQLTSVIGEAK